MPPETITGACHHDCPDTCVWEVTVEDGTAVKLRGSAEHPTTRGELCPKVNRFLDRVYHPDRLLWPLRRVGTKGEGRFERISWDEALDTIAERLTRIVDNAGPEAILPYSFDGTQGLIQKGVMARRFFNALGTSRIRRHLCGVTAWLGAADVSGLPVGIDPQDLAYSKTVVLWGTNTRLTNRHLWPVIEDARRNGATVVVIDPIRTATADQADHFLQIRPGTDVALVLALIHVIERDGLVDHDWIDRHTSGWELLAADARAVSLTETAAITRIDIPRIEWLAHALATGRPAAIRTLVGPEHRQHGQEIFRAITMLPAVTGAWRDRGGGLARSTQIYFEEALGSDEDDPTRRAFNMASLGQVLTDPTLSPPIQALIVHNSNPGAIAPDQNTVMRGLARDDLFTVVLEQFMTDTARSADIVLPATTQLEHPELMITWGHLYLALNQPAIEPQGEARSNTDVFRFLAARMELAAPGLEDSDEALIRHLLESHHPYMDGITYERLVGDGWARLNVAEGFRPNVDAPPATPDGRLQLGPLRYQAGSETPDGDPELAERFPLGLISLKQHPKFLNANYGGFAKHFPRAGEPRLEIHPSDATDRAINDGDQVRVFNDRGSLDVAAVQSDRVQPGLVAVPFGWWASHSPGGRSVNALTNPAVQDGVGSAAFHDSLVEVELIAEGRSHGER